MKIPLNLRQDDGAHPTEDADRAIERDVEACRHNDWEAKARLVSAFMPLLTTLARKRAPDIASQNRCIEAGKEGLVAAVRKYKSGSDQKFRVFVVAYIESHMDRARSEGRGFFARLFGR
jgi:DNA-directed RNA polymerase specialized sigma subunit